MKIELIDLIIRSLQRLKIFEKSEITLLIETERNLLRQRLLTLSSNEIKLLSEQWNNMSNN